MEQKKEMPSEEELKKYHGFTQDTIKGHYDDLAEKYDDVLLSVGYPDPEECAKLVEGLELAKTAEIFDMGCGTGLVGASLKKRGYAKVVGVDASPQMLEESKTKEAYTELKELFLGSPDTFPEEFQNRFDAITAAGILAEGHLGPDVFNEMLLALRPQGYAIFTTREEYLEKYKYGERI